MRLQILKFQTLNVGRQVFEEYSEAPHLLETVTGKGHGLLAQVGRDVGDDCSAFLASNWSSFLMFISRVS